MTMNAPPEHRNPDLSAVEIAKLEGQMKEGFAALGGKLDTLIAKQEAAETARALDRTTADARHEDHEARLRAHEDDIAGVRAIANNAVTPLKLWTVVATLLGLMGTASLVVLSIVK